MVNNPPGPLPQLAFSFRITRWKREGMPVEEQEVFHRGKYRPDDSPDVHRISRHKMWMKNRRLYNKEASRFSTSFGEQLVGFWDNPYVRGKTP